MSVDVELSPNSSFNYVSLMNSAGIFRLWTGHRVDEDHVNNLKLSDPLTPEALQQLKILIGDFDMGEYEAIYYESIYREKNKTRDINSNISKDDTIKRWK